jgi:hypothetical protein
MHLRFPRACLKMFTVLRNLTRCSLVEIYRRFGGIYCLLLHDGRLKTTVFFDVVPFILVDMLQKHIPEDRNYDLWPIFSLTWLSGSSSLATPLSDITFARELMSLNPMKSLECQLEFTSLVSVTSVT